ncbi:SIMPL domain-containing protein [Niallia oryzisoli]|uniref:SIMPL domain-containing protein n=1 Tax=Niallia oryzisoli TaxID=1737571 RepID=A0ABZ2CGU2_9BACI
MQFSKGFQPYQHYSPYRSYYPFTLTIEGEGKIRVSPDQATITLGVITENPNVQIAQEENTAISNSVILALKQIGIDDSEIRTTVYSVNPRYDFIEGKSILKGYEVEHHFEVTVKDLTTIGNVYDMAMKNGANRSGMIQFFVANPDVFYQEALKKAVENAQKKATEISSTIGATLSLMPIKITEQRDQSLRPFPAFSAAAASVTKNEVPPIQTGDYTIVAHVRVVYAYGG